MHCDVLRAPKRHSARTGPSGTRSTQAALRTLARQHGVETSYIDTTGKRREVSRETLEAILKLRGCDATSIQNERALHVPANLLPPVCVAWDGLLQDIGKMAPVSRADKRCQIQIQLENGACERVEGRLADLKNLHRKLQRSIGKFPPGYHHLQLEANGETLQSLLIAAPRLSYCRTTNRAQQLGVFAPLYAVHSKQSWGAGNLSDLKRLTEWAANQGSRVVATLPLMACFLESGADPSPYAPITRLFWNEFYVDIEGLPEFASSTAARKKLASKSFRKQLDAIRKSAWVDYAQQMKLRREMLQMLAPLANQAELDSFVRNRPLAREYARFRAVHDRLGIAWQHWPERLRNGNIKTAGFSPEDERYYLFAQLAAQRQMDELTAVCRQKQVQLYLDLPVGVNRRGFDVWRDKDLFAFEAGVGAPPDMFFNEGQNWGFPPMIPERMRETGYAHVIEYLRFQMRHAGILRIDHVMGLHRLYWIPPGFSAKAGAYVKYPAEELHALVCLESHRNQCEIVGENLGIVPDEVNQAMDEHRYRKMYIVQFEQQTEQPALRNPPANAVASLETHDTPTFSAHWLGEDIDFRVKLGQLKRENANAEFERRQKLNTATKKFLIAKRALMRPHSDPRTIMRALVQWLKKSAAGIVLLSLESLWEEKKPQNVPGTLDQYPNWRRKAALSLEDIEKRIRVSDAQ